MASECRLVVVVLNGELVAQDLSVAAQTLHQVFVVFPPVTNGVDFNEGARWGEVTRVTESHTNLQRLICKKWLDLFQEQKSECRRKI